MLLGAVTVIPQPGAFTRYCLGHSSTGLISWTYLMFMQNLVQIGRKLFEILQIMYMYGEQHWVLRRASKL